MAMSTQDAIAMSFEIATEPQNLRLLELPPSLLETIRSDDPPSLTLKSIASLGDGTQQPLQYAVLCTNNQTFQVRQVQSSNSVFVLQPTKQALPSNDNSLPSTSLRAIAQCPSLLELVPTSPSAIAFLRQEVPKFEERSDDFTLKSSTIGLNPWDSKRKHRLLEDAPFSAGEFDKAWREICAFEHGDTSWIPSAVSLANVWRAAVLAAAVRDVKLDQTFSVSAIASIADEESFPAALLEALLARISLDEQVTMDGYVRLDRAKCVTWVGAVILESLGGELSALSFLQNWQDRLPEAWREDASLEALKGKYSQSSSGLIIYDDSGHARDITQSAGVKTATTKARPNWHEKFRNAKR